MGIAIGQWAFIIGIVLAVIAGFLAVPYLTLILVILGLIVGFLNISGKETLDFLVAGIALTLGGSITALDAIPAIGTFLTAILKNIAIFVVPAILVVALKSVTSLAKSE